LLAEVTPQRWQYVGEQWHSAALGGRVHRNEANRSRNQIAQIALWNRPAAGSPASGPLAWTDGRPGYWACISQRRAITGCAAGCLATGPAQPSHFGWHFLPGAGIRSDLRARCAGVWGYHRSDSPGRRLSRAKGQVRQFNPVRRPDQQCSHSADIAVWPIHQRSIYGGKRRNAWLRWFSHRGVGRQPFWELFRYSWRRSSYTRTWDTSYGCVAPWRAPRIGRFSDWSVWWPVR